MRKEHEKKKEYLLRRLKRIHEHLKKENLDAFLVSQEQNRHYLTGWSSDAESGFVLITSSNSFILTDSRYTEHAVKDSIGFEVLEYESSVSIALRDLSKKLNLNRVGYESHDLSVFAFKKLKRYNTHLNFVPIAYLIEDARSIKDPTEISKLKKAVVIADEAFNYILNLVKPGMTEKEIAWEIEKYMKEAGAQTMAWEPFIVASGPRSSMPHYGAGSMKIKKSDMVLLDYGCVVDGYHSDTTRMIFMGKPSAEQKKIYNLVLEAQRLGESLVKNNIVGSTVDKGTHKFLDKQTKHAYRHSLGHGVGLQVHEEPRLSLRSKNKLKSGNTITVEPGIYIPGWGGVRLEDIVLVTNNGCDIVTKAPKDIRQVTI